MRLVEAHTRHGFGDRMDLHSPCLFFEEGDVVDDQETYLRSFFLFAKVRME